MQTKERKRKGQVEAAFGVTAFLRRPGIHLLFFGWFAAWKDYNPEKTYQETAVAFKERFLIFDEIETETLIREFNKTLGTYVTEGI